MGNTSYDWSILNVQAECRLSTLDHRLNESYVKLIEDRKSLTVSYNTFIYQYQTIAGQIDFLMAITRSLSRHKSVFVSFHKGYGAGNGSNIM